MHFLPLPTHSALIDNVHVKWCNHPLLSSSVSMVDIGALICYLHNPKFFFLVIPQGPLGMSIGNIRSAQKAFRVPQSSVFCHFPCFIEISPKNGICSQSRIFWPIFKCHTILESYRQHGRRATLQVKIRGLNKEL